MKKITLLVLIFHFCFIVSKGQLLEPLGHGLRLSGSSIGIEFDSTTNRTFIAGEFTQVDTVDAWKFAWKDSSGWHTFHLPYNQRVNTMKFADGKLYAAGNFSSIDNVPMNNIGYWDTTGWHAMGSGINGGAYSIEYYNSEIYVSGYLTDAGGISVSCIAKWDGNNWQSIGSGPDGSRLFMKVMDDTLYAFGSFSNFNGFAANQIVTYDGTTWSPVLLNDTNLEVININKFNNKLVVSVFNQPANKYQVWTQNGSFWSLFVNNLKLDIYINPNVMPLEVYNDTLYVFDLGNSGSKFIDIFKVNHNGAITDTLYARRRDSQMYFSWLHSRVYQGALYIGGTFTNLENVDVSGIVKIENSTVTSPFYISTSYQSGGSATASGIGMYFDSTSNKLLVGGHFEFAGDIPAKDVATWDGTTWGTLGAGFSDTVSNTPSTVNCFARFNNKLYAGGKFIFSGNKIVNNFASWNGTSWDSIGNGSNGAINNILEYDGALYVIGTFTYFNIFSTADGIIKYDGTTWKKVPGLANLGNYVNSACIYNNELLITGNFVVSGNVEHIVAFNGTSWHAFPGTGASIYYQLKVLNGELYAVTDGVYKFDGTNWNLEYSVPFSALYYANSLFNHLLVSDGHFHKTLFQTDSGTFNNLCTDLIYNTFSIDSTSAYFVSPITRNFTSGHIINCAGIIRKQHPVVQFDFDTDTVCDQQYVNFIGKYSDYTQDREWHLPGGIPSIATTFTVSTKYSVPGDYDVTLKLTNAFYTDSLYMPNLIHVENCGLGLDEIDLKTVILYPNPANEILTVSFPPDFKIESMSFVDMLGRSIPVQMEHTASNSNKIVLSCANLKSGLYNLMINSGDKIICKKFVRF